MIEPADPALAREIILEYASGTGVDLSFQDFSHELENLATFYEAIYVGKVEGAAAGCVALRRIDDDICEMKRLYVRAQFRGRDIGRQLAKHVIEEATGRGYRRMRLDTLPTMTSAIALYHSLGFVEIAPYRFNPVEGSKFMEIELKRFEGRGST